MALIVKPTGLEKIWASGGVKETPADSKITQGHVVELPAYQYVNWLVNKQDTFIAHVNQVGIPVWDAVTEYIGGKSYVQGTDGVVYKALLTNTNVVPSNPLNSATWVKAFEDFGSVAALTVTVNDLSTNYSTLAGIANTAAARNNLSVYSKTESDARFAPVLGNAANTFLVANATNDSHAINRGQLLSLLNQATEAASGVAAIATQSESDVGTNDTKILTPKKATATFVKRSNNLSDLTNATAARTNLGLTSTATTDLTSFLLKADSLAGIGNPAAARTNLGLGSAATLPSTDFLLKSSNLSDLTDKPTARSNLGLGNAAIKNTGVAAGTVAEGDDSRIVNAVQTSRVVTAGNGLTGGGGLGSNITLNLGSPGTVSVSSSNTVFEDSHSHALDLSSFFANRNLNVEGWQVFPGGFTIQWGAVYSIPGDGTKAQLFPRAFDAVFQVIGGKRNPTPIEGDANACGAYAASNTTLVAFNDSNRYANSVSYVAFGWVAGY